MTDPQTVYSDLAGKVVAITGGASGIGAAIVTAFHKQGAQVVFFDKDEVAGVALAESLGKSVHFQSLDLTDIEALTTRFAESAAMVGDFDVLVNNAAHDDRHEIASVTPAYWRKQLAVNLDHQFFATQAVIQGMRQKGAGAIVNMSSIAWRVGLESAPAYVASKAAIEGLTHSLARELGPAGIRVNCLLPGFVRTKRQVDNWLTPEFEQRIMNSQCLTRFIEPEDIAEMVIMLTSDASRAVTNQALVVDAGWT